MSQKSIVEHFDKWLIDNIDRFEHKPINIEFNKYSFEGIVENIILVLDDNNCESIIEYHNNEIKYDTLLLGYIENLKYIEDKGYTDTAWIGKFKDNYYSTYADIINENIFNPIVKYCNDVLIKENHLYLVDMKSNEITFALIGDNSQEKEIQKLEDACVQIDKKLNKVLADNPKVYKFDIFTV